MLLQAVCDYEGLLTPVFVFKFVLHSGMPSEFMIKKISERHELKI